MAFVASLILCVGLNLVLVTVIFAAISAGNVRLRRVLRRTAPTPIGSWPARTGLVSTEAVVEYGPAGPQVAPISGEECAWYSVTLTRANRTDRGSRSSDFGTTPAPPILTDGTGWVTIDTRLLVDRWGEARNYRAVPVCEVTTDRYQRGAQRPEWVSQGMADSLGYTESFAITEVRLPHGRPAFAMGRVVNGVLRPGSQARIHRGTWAGVIEATAADISVMTRAIPAFIVIGAVIGVAGFGMLLYVTTGHLTW
jgi:hypothetical protein